MVKKTQARKRAFGRPKEQRSNVVNFKDCRPESQTRSHGQEGFVRHVGPVKFIEKSNVQVEIKGKRTQAQCADTDEFQLKVLLAD
jgi:hypothetical protein